MDHVQKPVQLFFGHLGAMCPLSVDFGRKDVVPRSKLVALSISTHGSITLDPFAIQELVPALAMSFMQGWKLGPGN